ncbi:Uncharacterised protein [Vibrio cholerae]|nr:Uncharacterised protein [Vibrio cholerae]CSI81533.1 Uncharacterised protein [Vibrio cholerae]
MSNLRFRESSKAWIRLVIVATGIMVFFEVEV